MSFDQLGLGSPLLRAISRQGYESPTPIQLQAIPAVLGGADVMAAAQTGTGKTAAFTLPLLEILRKNSGQRRNPRVLVLTPTRELAAQVETNVREYGADLNLRSAVIFGGVGAAPQIKALRRGVDLLIATPGRLLDHLGQGHVDLSQVEHFVLDEADRMLDMGFIRDIRRVIKALPQVRQNLLFSATFSKEIRELARGLLKSPVEIDVAPKQVATELVDQKVVHVAKATKRALVSWLIGSKNWRQVLVFTRTKHGANRLCKQLITDGLPAAALHGNKSQGARTRALAEFKAGDIRVLVATDIAARGLDIDQLPHVINYELPNVAADYVHRIGRTGRAGLNGEAISLIDTEERGLLRDIERLLGSTIEQFDVAGFDLPTLPAPQPTDTARPGRSNRRRGGARGQGASRGQNPGQNPGQNAGQNQNRRRRGGQRQGSGNGRGRQAA